MHAGAGLGDHARLAHPPRQQRLADRIVDLVRPGVVQVLALDVDLRSAEPIGQGLPRSNKEASLLVIETRFGWVSSASAVADSLARYAETVAQPR